MSVLSFSTPTISQATNVFHHVLMATDFSEVSQRALAGAVTVATQNQAHLSVVHVLPTDWRYEMLDNPPEIDLERIDAQRRLEAATREIGFGKAPDCIILRHGPVPQKVIALVEEAGVDLLVIGTRGRAGLTKLALGSVGEELLRIAPCPVITFGPKAKVVTAPAHESAFHSILFATDFGAGSAKALPFVRAMAAAPSTRVALLHMIAPMPASSNLSAYASPTAAEDFQEWQASSHTRSVRQLKAWWLGDAKPVCEPEYIVGTDFLPEGVLTAADQRRCDLIVMGANHAASPRLAAHIPWSAVHEVISHAPCPVMTCVG